MGKATGFMLYERAEARRRPVEERVRDFDEVEGRLPVEALEIQAARCADCGVPFCHSVGCPLGNLIPDWNDMVYRKHWRRALELLHATDNFPEVTGRVCPAPCEPACTLAINNAPVCIRQIELEIAEHGWAQGWIEPQRARHTTGRRVAVVGSGPAGLAAAQQLARAGHDVVVFEKDKAIGGLLRYGVPDFKLDKKVIDRRLEQMRAEGVTFRTEATVGEDVSPKLLRKEFDAVCLAMGAGEPRDLAIPGRGLENIHFAMEFLTQRNRVGTGEYGGRAKRIDANGKVVVVIGGGDTGSDCVGTARRQGAKEIHQFEILPKPPEKTNRQTPWPTWPNILRTSSSHEEGCVRRWGVLTKRFLGAGVRVRELQGCEVEWVESETGWAMQELAGTDFSMKVDLVLLAMGFKHVVHGGLVESLGLKRDASGNLAVNEQHETSGPGIFAAGDAVSGASLVVRAIADGREAAASMDRWLKNSVG